MFIGGRIVGVLAGPTGMRVGRFVGTDGCMWLGKFCVRVLSCTVNKKDYCKLGLDEKEFTNS